MPGQMSIVEKVIRYLQLGRDIKYATAEKDEIGRYFKENIKLICEARGIATPEGEEPCFTIPVDAVLEYKVCQKRRPNAPKIDHEKLKAEFPEAFAACATASEDSVFVEIRQRQIQ